MLLERIRENGARADCCRTRRQSAAHLAHPISGHYDLSGDEGQVERSEFHQSLPEVPAREVVQGYSFSNVRNI